MTPTGWSQTLFFIGMLASLLIVIAYVKGTMSVRTQGRKMGWGVTVATLLALAAIVFVSLHGNLFAFLFTHTGSGLFSTTSPSASLPVAHAIAAASSHRHMASAGTHHVSSAVASSAPQPAPLLVTLEGIASIVGIVIALCILMTGLALLVRHIYERQEAAFLATSFSACAACGQEGEFPFYRDKKGQLAHLCTDCVPRFQVMPTV